MTAANVRPRGRTHLFICALLAAACGGAPADPVTVDLEPLVEAPDAVAEAGVEEGVVVVRGSVETPTPCYALEATVHDEDPADLDVVLLTIHTKPTDAELCAQMIDRKGYVARIRDVPAGEIILKVSHGDAEVLEQTLAVVH